MPNHLTIATRPFSSTHRTSDANAWWRMAVFYEVYIRSFQDSNADGIGDLRGITRRLPYLQQLGVDAIWITPFYNSPMADFGYDVSDYTGIDPSFGTVTDFEQLVQAAHKQGIRVVVDIVPNHSSDHHEWFIESRSSRNNPKRDWYIWADTKPDSSAPNNWTSFFGGSAWTWDEHTGQYYLHLFLDQQPDLNWRNPDLKQAMENVLHFWLQKGVDGFRLDAIPFLIKHPAMPDLPTVTRATGADLASQHIYVHNQPELHDILRDMRRIVDAYPGQRVLIGETGHMKPPVLAKFYGAQGDELHLPMIVLPIHTGWEAKPMRECLIGFYEGLPADATPHFVFSNHDDKRLITRYGYEHHRSIAMLLLTLRGSPILYYGDEIAMSDSYIPPERRVDTPGLIHPDQNPGRDPNRTPMQWTDAPQAGFTSDQVESWLPVAENRTTINVQAQEQDPRSTLNFYRQLLQIRKQSAALQTGSIQFLENAGDDVLAFLRESDGERLLIAINFGSTPRTLDLSGLTNHITPMLSSEMHNAENNTVSGVVLGAYESILYKLA